MKIYMKKNDMEFSKNLCYNRNDILVLIMNDNKDKKEVRKNFIYYSKIINIFTTLIGTILLGVLIGYLLDKWLKTDYWIIICILVFFFAAMVKFFKEIMKIK